MNYPNFSTKIKYLIEAIGNTDDGKWQPLSKYRNEVLKIYFFKLYKMKKISKFDLLRFPLLFGTMLSILGVGFLYREKWMGNIEMERSKLYKQNIQDDTFLEELKKMHKQK